MITLSLVRLGRGVRLVAEVTLRAAAALSYAASLGLVLVGGVAAFRAAWPVTTFQWEEYVPSLAWIGLGFLVGELSDLTHALYARLKYGPTRDLEDQQ